MKLGSLVNEQTKAVRNKKRMIKKGKETKRIGMKSTSEKKEIQRKREIKR